jgi:hypothetical protein
MVVADARDGTGSTGEATSRMEGLRRFDAPPRLQNRIKTTANSKLARKTRLKAIIQVYRQGPEKTSINSPNFWNAFASPPASGARQTTKGPTRRSLDES